MAADQTTTGATDWKPSANRYTNHADLLLFIRQALDHLRRDEPGNAIERLTNAEKLAELLPRDADSDPDSSIDSDAASIKLCQASAMLYVMAERYERHSQAICRVIPGRLHTDVDMIHAIIERVELVKDIIDGK